MENYEKLYKDALERARNYHKGHILDVNPKAAMEYIFPVLKESQDEKNIKDLIDELKCSLRAANCQNDACGGGHEKRIALLEWGIAWLENQGEQNLSDKVEPKFKVGDWIINNDKRIAVPTQILKIEEYGYVTSRGYTSFDKVKTDYHLWTIQDAKDGDVLATLGYILIFKEHLKDDGGISYCHYDFSSSNPQFIWLEDKNWHFGKEVNIHPATKEQRELLFQKMKEAGYEWDADKKELKKIERKSDKWEPQTGDTFRKKGTTSPTYHLCDKREDGITFGFVENREVGIAGGEITIFALREDYELVERPKSIEDNVEEELNRVLQIKVEQNPAWSEEDEQILNEFIESLRYYNGNGYNKQIDWLKSIKDRVQPQPTSEWSEEDEKLYTSALWHIKKSCGNGGIYNWLKSIKDRVQPQPKQEWSEEDELNLNSFLHKLEVCDLLSNKEIIWIKNKLKSIKHWKPSEEQIEELEYVTRGNSYPNLTSLYQDLKKL